MAILSIQSHVAFGHVGNAAATFPLQRKGWEVWAVHTVMFAAHAGYGPPAGPIFSPETIREVVAGLERQGFLSQCRAVLSGYLGDAALGEAVLDAVARVRRHNPDAVYCCDPVMGDAAPGVYVRDNIPDFMRDRAIPAADIATPNAFELELLTGIPIVRLEDAVASCQALRRSGPDTVLLTSLEREGTPDGMIEMLTVTGEGAWLVATPKLDLTPPPNGAGDLTAALFLANLLDGLAPPDALAATSASVQTVFQATARAGTRELAILDAQEAFVTPPVAFDAVSVG
jgi:pyridoxine kinase